MPSSIPKASISQKALPAQKPSSWSTPVRNASAWILLVLTIIAVVSSVVGPLKGSQIGASKIFRESIVSAPDATSVENITQLLFEHQARCFSHEARIQGLNFVQDPRLGQYPSLLIPKHGDQEQKNKSILVPFTKDFCLSLEQVVHALPQYQRHAHDLLKSKHNEIDSIERSQLQRSDDSPIYRSSDQASKDDPPKAKQMVTQFIKTWQERFEFFRNPIRFLEGKTTHAWDEAAWKYDALLVETRSELQSNEIERSRVMHTPYEVQELDKAADALRLWLDESKELGRHLYLVWSEAVRLEWSLIRRLRKAFAADLHQIVGDDSGELADELWDLFRERKDNELSHWERAV
ncbi:MAG: hypothetical protein Q9222_004493 [Ikaeria aurantiellina]